MSIPNQHDAHSTTAAQRSKPLRRPRRFLFWCVAILVVLLLLVLLAPTILTQTSSRDYLISRLVPADAAVVSMKSLKVGWFSPLDVKGLRILDATGAPLVEVDSIVGERTLLNYVSDYSDIGKITVTRPTLHAQLRTDGSNLEDTVAKFSTGESTTSTVPIAAEIVIEGARILATELATNRSWALEEGNVEVNLPKELDADWKVAFSGNVDGKPITLHAETPMGQASETWPLGKSGTFKTKLSSVPVWIARYFANRLGQRIEELDGTLTTEMVAEWKPATGTSTFPDLDVQVSGNVSELHLASSEYLAEDNLDLTAINVSASANIKQDVFTLSQFDVRSDFGSTHLSTAMELGGISDALANLDSLRRQPFETNGNIDLAAVARVLPNTCRIRPDVSVASGQLSWEVKSQSAEDQATQWTGSLQTSDVGVVKAGQPVDWNFPLEIRFSAVDDGQIHVDEFQAESDFFVVSGQGGLRSGHVQAQADLERFVYEVAQIVDMSGIYVRGGMRSDIKWSESETDQLQLLSRTELSRFVMTHNERVLCQEESLVASTSATAKLTGSSLASLDKARVDVVSADDFFIAELQEAVDQPMADQAQWPLVCRMKGDMATWFARLKTMGIGIDWYVDGAVDTTMQLTANRQGVAVHSLSTDIQNLQASTDGLQINEPVVQLRTAGTIDLTTLACRFPSTTLSSQSLALAANEVAVDMQPNLVVAGDVAYRANLARLMAIAPSVSQSTATPMRISGEATGRLQLQANADTTNFQHTGAIKELQATQDGVVDPVWYEPQVEINVEGAYRASEDILQLTRARVTGKVLSLVAAGQAENLSQRPDVDLSGEYGYDLDGLVTLLRNQIGPDISLSGNQRQKFAIRGPLFPQARNAGDIVAEELLAQAGAGWQAANLYGVELGPAQVEANLKQGLLKVSPFQVAVGEGKLQVTPTIHLNSEPLWVTLEPQTVADRVRITPQMTGSWMKYVAPLLADATSAEGTFSVTLGQAAVPMMDPMASKLDGELIVHGGALGPGPLATQFIDLATSVKRFAGQGDSRVMNSTKTWVQLAPQQVAFQVADNRVYHEGFQMEVDGVPIRTRGSVGLLDESIAVMAEVPILDEWVDRTPELAGLRGQTISIPVGGTTSNPKIDQSALLGVSTQLARTAAGGFLREKVGSKLQEELGIPVGGGSVDDAIGNAQDKLNDKIQNEIGRQLNKLFK